MSLFLAELRPEETVLPTTQAGDAPDRDQQLSTTATLEQDEALSPEANVLPGEPGVEDCINTDDPAQGWMRATATRNAHRLHNFLGRGRYQCLVLPTHCPGRYGFVIIEQETGYEWVYLTSEDIDGCINRQGEKQTHAW